MRWRAVALGLTALPVLACAAILGIDDGIARDAGADGSFDAQSEPEAGPCNLGAPFGAPIPLSELNTPDYEAQPRLSPDELTVYFERSVVDAGYDLFTASRAMVTTKFAAPTPIAELNTQYNDSDPTVSPDQLRIIFSSDRPGGLGAADAWQAMRDAAGPFQPSADTPNVNSTQNEYQTYYVPGALYFASDRSSTYHVYRAAELSGGFASPLLIAELQSPGSVEECPVVTPDELRIYFASNRSDGGALQVWTSSRATISQPWPTPTLVTELASFGNVVPSWVSPDGCRLYVSSDKSGNEDMYVVGK